MISTAEIKYRYLRDLISLELDRGYDYHKMMHRILQYASMSLDELKDNHLVITSRMRSFSEINAEIKPFRDGFLIGLIYGLAYLYKKPMSQLYSLSLEELIFIAQILDFVYHHEHELGGKLLTSVLYGMKRARDHDVPPDNLHLLSIFRMALRLTRFEEIPLDLHK